MIHQSHNLDPFFTNFLLFSIKYNVLYFLIQCIDQAFTLCINNFTPTNSWKSVGWQKLLEYSGGRIRGTGSTCPWGLWHPGKKFPATKCCSLLLSHLWKRTCSLQWLGETKERKGESAQAQPDELSPHGSVWEYWLDLDLGMWAIQDSNSSEVQCKQNVGCGFGADRIMLECGTLTSLGGWVQICSFGQILSHFW